MVPPVGSSPAPSIPANAPPAPQQTAQSRDQTPNDPALPTKRPASRGAVVGESKKPRAAPVSGDDATASPPVTPQSLKKAQERDVCMNTVKAYRNRASWLA